MEFCKEQYILPLTQLYKKYSVEDDRFFMKKYMKNKFDFFGLRKKNREKAEKEFLAEYGMPEICEMKCLMNYLYALPQREYQYFGMIVARKLVKKYDENFLEVIEKMITTKSWWDTVDFIAANLAGPYFQKFPDRIKTETQKWMDSHNLWLQRSALLFQLRYKDETDFELMKTYIEPLSSSGEFFIRKAIGWCLREYSKTNADAVRKYVEKTDISNFSKKEALKWLDKQKA